MNKRIFKFRAWDANKKKLFQVEGMMRHGITLSDWVMFNNDSHSDDALMQWTGFTDKEGKDIYEGDLVKGSMGVIYKVFWGKLGGCWRLGIIGLITYVSLSDGTKGDLEIIGNIYENPDLLEVDDG